MLSRAKNVLSTHDGFQNRSRPALLMTQAPSLSDLR
jgi:hypothetical protein